MTLTRRRHVRRLRSTHDPKELSSNWVDDEKNLISPCESLVVMSLHMQAFQWRVNVKPSKLLAYTERGH